MNNVKVLTILGTRPEAIKMAPLITKLVTEEAFEAKLCVTGQHREMLDQVLTLFDLKPDFDLAIMQAGQDLTDISVRILQQLKILFAEYRPDIVLVHGDTTTALASSLACYYHQIPLAHIEAGLRTGNRFSPFPEEINRQLISSLADYHFAPTETAKQNLLRENKPAQQIWVTGNTVIDALRLALAKIEANQHLQHQLAEQYAFLDPNKPLILVTCHRRESFGKGIQNICVALLELANRYPDIQIVYPLHLNPNVRQPVQDLLANIDNIFLIEPQDYLPFVYLMDRSYLILTDSGGIQEEAPALAKPVLVMRDISERSEAIAVGAVRIVGTDSDNIVAEVHQLLTDKSAYQQMAQAGNPYGQGDACQQIIAILKQHLI
ncbi:non-hydrolyzing UDP-N-acetylglucosamine 2-epimerase [[Haemophilus] ducreyi]